MQATSSISRTEGWKVPLHPDAHEGGGLACNDEVLLKEQREAVTEWIKSMGRQLFTGSFNLVSVPFPVRTFEPRSYLEKIADVWVYPRYLLEASNTSDPVQRMQLVMTWFVAGLHHIFGKWRKPFNPILGETWQASMSDGTSVFMEQISHHPPISAYHMEGPGHAYKFCGVSQPHVALVLKHYGFKSQAKGFRYIEFPDGSRIDMEFPGYYVKNVVYSSKPRAEMDGCATFMDAKNNLEGVINFGATPTMRRTDAVWGGIYQLDTPVASKSGQRHVMSTVLDNEEDNHVRSPRVSTRRQKEDLEDLEEYFESASETADWDTRELEDRDFDLSSWAAAAAADGASPPLSLPQLAHHTNGSTTATNAASGAARPEAGAFGGPGGLAAAAAAAAAAATSPRGAPPASSSPMSGSASQVSADFATVLPSSGPHASAPLPLENSSSSVQQQQQQQQPLPPAPKPRKRSHLSSIKKHLAQSLGASSSSKSSRRKSASTLGSTSEAAAAAPMQPEQDSPPSVSCSPHSASDLSRLFHRHGSSKSSNSKHRLGHQSSSTTRAAAPQAGVAAAAAEPVCNAAPKVSSTLHLLRTPSSSLADANALKPAAPPAPAPSTSGNAVLLPPQHCNHSLIVTEQLSTSSQQCITNAGRGGHAPEAQRSNPQHHSIDRAGEGQQGKGVTQVQLDPLHKAATLSAPLEEELSVAASKAEKKAHASRLKRLDPAFNTIAVHVKQEDEKPPGKLLAAVEGSWLSHFDVDGVRQWTLLSEPHDNWVGFDDALPSDSRFRADLQALLRGDLKAAQTQKELMEKRQRQDKKVREGRGESTQ
ncbi:hypothetical protein DUNSADRAFT_2576 [Dunaliella salina]|uniref:Oxysterol-binding protein n=1 Tax=Dunaliella salina TaxID=3046 RepID=A0ABQ7GVG9_DUNSA|nr:hypothetical protein DUNSADRAFT_2576 [Dunaliella salina]|eukprot:KAF5838592.1 hypothetical protein DUNSADRAFT_2576 [Dunaliella salina]